MRFCVFCQEAKKFEYPPGTDERWKRVIFLSIRGFFTLEEAEDYAVKSLDSPVALPVTVSFGYESVIVLYECMWLDHRPIEIEHLMDHYSTIDYCDKYTFFLMLHHLEMFRIFLETEREELKEIIRRDKKKEAWLRRLHSEDPTDPEL